MNGEEFTALAAWLFLVSLGLPLLNALIKRRLANSSKEAQSIVVFLACVIAGAGQAFFNGSLKWADGDPQAMAGIIVINFAVVISFAYTFYKNLWQATGVDAKISGSK